MGLFTRYAMDALMKTSHPEVIRRQCWNLHPHRTPCTACKDICPYGDAIFTRPNLVKDWDPCTDCGLCVSVCRSRCICPLAGAGGARHLCRRHRQRYHLDRL
mgnify:CR=1 FL=1